MIDSNRFPALVLASLIPLFVIVGYLPAIGGPFTFDDYPHIVLDPGAQPESWSELDDSLTGPAQDRPVARITFGLNYLWSGLQPTAYHATNIAIHIAGALTLFALLLALVRAPRSPEALARHGLAFAFAGALLWAIHPVNTQAVSYIVQRMASMAALFYLATLLLFVMWRLGRLRARVALPLMLAMWALALGSKLNAATAPAAWWLIEVAFFTGFTRRNLRLGGLVLVGGLLAALLFGLRGGHLDHLFTAPSHRDFSGLERMLTQARILWHYISLVLWPDAARLQIDYAVEVSRGLLTPWTTLWALLAWGAGAIAAAIGIHRRRLLWPSVGLLFFLLGSSVESSFILLELVFEHRVYLPSALLIPGLIAPFFALPACSRTQTATRLTFLLLAAVLTWQTLERNRLWAQPRELWAQALEQGAKPHRSRTNAALAAYRKARTEDTARLVGSAGGGEDDPSTPLARSGAVRVALIEGRLEEARKVAERGLRNNPRSLSWAYLYGLTLYHLGRLEEARDIARQILDHAPDRKDAIVLDSLIQQKAGAPDAAIQRLRHWLEAHRDQSIGVRNDMRLHLANILYRHGEPSAALDLYRKIIQKQPLAWSAWVNIAQVLRASGEIERAKTVEDYLRARDVDVEALKGYAQPQTKEPTN